MPKLQGKLLNSSWTGSHGLQESLYIRGAWTILTSMSRAARSVTGLRSDPDLILKCLGWFFATRFTF